MAESVRGIEFGPEEFYEVGRLFEAVDMRHTEAIHYDEVNRYPGYVLVDRDPITLKLMNRFGLCDNYEEFLRHGMDAHFVELSIPVKEDPGNPYQSLLGSENLSRFVQIVMRRGNLYEALTVHNFKADNFGSGETDRVLTNRTFEEPLSPSARLRRLADTITDHEKFRLVPLRP